MSSCGVRLVAMGLGLFFCCPGPFVMADTINVCGDSSGDYVTIQEGIDAAVDGDEVVICPGTYSGDGNRDLVFGNGLPPGELRSITVRSSDPDDPVIVASTIIDCGGTEAEPHRGFSVEGPGNAPTKPPSTISGLTITNAYDYAIYCYYRHLP